MCPQLDKYSGRVPFAKLEKAVTLCVRSKRWHWWGSLSAHLDSLWRGGSQIEDGGRATVDLQSGKVGLAIVRQRMKPGEVIEVHTPHAIAAVRGPCSWSRSCLVPLAAISSRPVTRPPGPRVGDQALCYFPADSRGGVD
jgi:hypothetical protein